jgi:hypothetical protein
MRMLASALCSKPVPRPSPVRKAPPTPHPTGSASRMPKLRSSLRWYAEADWSSRPAGAAQVDAYPIAQTPRITVRDGATPDRSAPPSAPRAGDDSIHELVRALFKSTYDQLPLNAHYTVVLEVPNDYALLYKHGYHLLQVVFSTPGLDRITLPLNPADEMRVLESKAALEKMVASIRARPYAFYPFSLEGVHLMRLARDPLYKPTSTGAKP